MKKRLEVKIEKQYAEMIDVLCFEQGLNKSDLIRSLVFDKYNESEQ